MQFDFQKVQTRRQYPTLQCFCAVKVPLPAKACDTKAGGQARIGGIVRLRRHYAARARQRHTRGAVQVHIG
jgi:hypothetical protein